MVGGSPGLKTRSVARVLAASPSVCVVGEESEERSARATLDRISVDVAVLDATAPTLDAEALRMLRTLVPSVLLGPESSSREGEVRKPRAGDLDDLGRFGKQLTDAIERTHARRSARPPEAAGHARPGSAPAPPAAWALGGAAPKPGHRPLATDFGVAAVVIASSTGGPDALAAVFASLPKDLAAPVLVVQHMPPRFADLLATRLHGLGGLAVRVAKHDEPIVPGVAWLAPGDQHLEVARPDDRDVVMRLTRGAPENGCRPAADVLFRTSSLVFRRKVLAVVLTGMGTDGAAGCVAVRDAGGAAWAQDEASSTVWGMPGAAVRSGAVSRVLPLESLGPEIARRVGVRSRVHP